MRHGSLFSGIGGFDLAAQWMGWENVFQVEWDKWCQQILTKNFPNSLRFGDIVEFNKMLQNGEIITDTDSRRLEGSSAEGERAEYVKWNNKQTSEKSNVNYRIGRIDIITGGFPCQPFSHAGKRKGTDDSRYLWPEMLTTIRILKPAFVVGENVAGLVSMENGKTLDRILSDLENEGYTTEQVIIPACAIGAWHRRDRIWIIAYSNSIGWNNWRDNRSKRYIQTNKGIAKKSESKWQGWECGFSEIGTTVTDSNSKYRKELLGGDKLGETFGKEAFRWSDSQYGGIWESEPAVGRVAHGIPNRVDRLKGLGNAIVPQVVYQIFKAIESLA